MFKVLSTAVAKFLGLEICTSASVLPVQISLLFAALRKNYAFLFQLFKESLVLTAWSAWCRIREYDCSGSPLSWC